METNLPEKTEGAAQLRKLEQEELQLSVSQWTLMWRAFKKHKLAMTATIFLFAFYVVAVFSGFFAPNDPHHRWTKYIYTPPQIPRFIDGEGRFHLQPFIYGLKQEIDDETWERIYVFDEEQKYKIVLFPRGAEYKLMGFIPASIHLFGIREQDVPFFLFGSDELGRDLFSRIIYGTRVSLSIGLIGVFLSLVLGLLIGGVSGLFGGVVDMVIQRIIEVLISIPRIPFWMALSAALPADWPPLKIYFSITILLSLVGWVQVARVVRGKFLSLRDEDFVHAAETMGAGQLWIIFRHLVPNFFSYVLVQVTLAIPWMIIAETSLSFLGIGLRAPVVSWGVLLQQAQNMRTVSMHPWLLLPGVFVIIAVLVFNFVGDGMRDAADPYSD
jgi:peptide/nickel transport system permease protein